MSQYRQHHPLDLLALRAFGQGDADALRELVDQVRPVLVAACRGLVRDPAIEAEDHAQEAIIKAAEWRPGTFKLPARPGPKPAILAFLCTTARNIAKSSIAKAANRDELLFGPFACEDDTTRTAHARAQASWVRSQVEPDVDTCSDDRLERVFEKLPSQDVIDLLDWAEGRQVRNRMAVSRAKKRARDVAERQRRRAA